MIKTKTIIYRILPACLLLLILAACSTYEISEDQAEVFLKFFGSYGEDVGSKVLIDDDGGYVIIGTWTDTDGNKGKRMCLIKTDKYGNEADWSPARFDAGNNDDKDDFGYDLLITDDGYVLVGSSESAESEGGDMDILLVKTDKQGNAQSGFPRTIDIGGNEEGFEIAESDEFGYILLGYADNHPLSNDFGDPDVAADNDMVFVITQENGDTVRTRQYGFEGEDEGRCIIKTDFGFLLVGSSTSFSGDGNAEVFFVKTSPIGVRLGFTTTGTPNNDVGECIKLTPDGTYIISGTSTNITSEQPRIFLAEVTDDLNISKITVSKTGNFTGKSVNVTPEGDFILVGTITTTDDNIYIMGLDRTGGEMYYTTFGRTGEQSASSFCITPDGGLIILGSNSYGGNSMITLVKTGPEGSME
jgi:hypothetical protein